MFPHGVIAFPPSMESTSYIRTHFLWHKLVYSIAINDTIFKFYSCYGHYNKHLSLWSIFNWSWLDFDGIEVEIMQKNLFKSFASWKKRDYDSQ